MDYRNCIEANSGDFGSFGIFRSDRFDRVGRAVQRYVFGNNGASSDKAERLDTLSNKYDVYKLYDSSLNSSYIDLVGFLDEGYLVFIRSGYENIQESVAIDRKSTRLNSSH